MSPLARVRARWRRRRLARAAAKRRAEPLREFVYLDEVSVFSLISSRIGPIATEFTDTQTSSLTSEISSNAQASAPLVKGELRSRMQSVRSSGTQVLRKATVQATFRELAAHISDDLVMRAAAAEAPGVPAVSAGPLDDGAKWAVSAADLRRGALVEVEVVLEAEPIFHMSTLMDTFLELFQDAPDLLPPGMRGDLGEAGAMNAVMTKLLAGLVPLRGRAVHHVVVISGGNEYVVDRRVTGPLPADLEIRELHVVATAEAQLFWKDLRRLLFNDARYTMLCRVSRDGLDDSWNPVQLADMARSMLPDAADQLDAAQRSLAALMRRGEAPPVAPATDDRLPRALRRFASALARHHDLTWTLEDVSAAADRAPGTAVEDLRPAFAAVAEEFHTVTGTSTDRAVLARLRHEALQTTEAEAQPTFVGTAAQDEQPRVLATEVIAIYW